MLLSAILVARYCQLSDISCWTRDFELSLFYFPSHISYKAVITRDVWDSLFGIIRLLTMYGFSFSPYFYAKKKKKNCRQNKSRKNTKWKPMASLTPLELYITGSPAANKQCLFQTNFIQSYKCMNKTYSSHPTGWLSSNQCHICHTPYLFLKAYLIMKEILKEKTKI